MAKTVITYTKQGEVKHIKSSAGYTRHCKAAQELLRNNTEPTTTRKIIRFCKRFISEIKRYRRRKRIKRAVFGRGKLLIAAHSEG